MEASETTVVDLNRYLEKQIDEVRTKLIELSVYFAVSTDNPSIDSFLKVRDQIAAIKTLIDTVNEAVSTG